MPSDLGLVLAVDRLTPPLMKTVLGVRRIEVRRALEVRAIGQGHVGEVGRAVGLVGLQQVLDAACRSSDALMMPILW